jgi:hypothetical protein
MIRPVYWKFTFFQGENMLKVTFFQGEYMQAMTFFQGEHGQVLDLRRQSYREGYTIADHCRRQATVRGWRVLANKLAVFVVC